MSRLLLKSRRACLTKLCGRLLDHQPVGFILVTQSLSGVAGRLICSLTNSFRFQQGRAARDTVLLLFVSSLVRLEARALVASRPGDLVHALATEVGKPTDSGATVSPTWDMSASVIATGSLSA